MPVSAATYEQVALEDPEGKWELVCGRLRQKPAMTTEHNEVARRLLRRLVTQLDERAFSVDVNATKLRIPSGSYYIPDLTVLPRAAIRRLRERPGTFEVYDEPVPLVVEVWSPKTGDYDVEEKLREYQARGDAEIWRLHPYDRTLMRWLRQPDGGYQVETVIQGDVLPVALSGVRIRVSELFE